MNYHPFALAPTREHCNPRQVYKHLKHEVGVNLRGKAPSFTALHTENSFFRRKLPSHSLVSYAPGRGLDCLRFDHIVGWRIFLYEEA